MPIIRSARPASDFSTYSNSVIYDKRLSMKELGLLVRLLSRPDHWETNSETLAREFNCGRDQMRSVLGKLRDYGYVRLIKAQDASTGFWFSNWIVFDNPQESPIEDEPSSASPGPGNGVLGLSDALVKTDYQRLIANHQPRLKKDHSESFDKFWKAYPRKIGKDAAQKAFNKRNPDDNLLGEMLKAIEVQKTTEDWRKSDGQFIPHPATWLNQGRWMDEVAGMTKAIGQTSFLGVI